MQRSCVNEHVVSEERRQLILDQLEGDGKLVASS
jgi:hypothetical protein